MSNLDYTWIGIGTGLILVFAAFVCSKRSKSIDHKDASSSEKDSIQKSFVSSTSAQENIRQIALVEKDEFEKFYCPVIENIRRYEQLITGEILSQSYFDTVYKALRKRRSAIFEFGSSEQDQDKRALWTFALFAAISIRFIAYRLSEYEFTLHQQNLDPKLLQFSSLSQCNVQKTNVNSTYKSDLTNIHLIDKILANNVIGHLNKFGVYSFVVNSVTGFYQERINPFYTIIEDVESHVTGNRLDEHSLFMRNLRLALTLIQQGSFSKNQSNSLVFEGISYLLVDRNFFWEIFRGYAVYSASPFSKKEFELQLTKALNLKHVWQTNSIYIVSVEMDEVDKSQEKQRLKLSNMIALPYKAVPFYQHSDRKRIEKQTLQREIVVHDTVRGLAEHDVIASDKTDHRNDKSSTDRQPKSVGVNDLFSGS